MDASQPPLQHPVNPTWSDYYTHVICKTCRGRIVGDGSSQNPWRHPDDDINVALLAQDAEATYFAALVETRDILLGDLNLELDRLLKGSVDKVLELIDKTLARFCSICNGTGSYEDWVHGNFSTVRTTVKCDHVNVKMLDAEGKVIEPGRPACDNFAFSGDEVRRDSLCDNCGVRFDQHSIEAQTKVEVWRLNAQA